MTGIARLSWNPFTAPTVIDPYEPVTLPENQPICLNRATVRKKLALYGLHQHPANTHDDENGDEEG